VQVARIRLLAGAQRRHSLEQCAAARVARLAPHGDLVDVPQLHGAQQRHDHVALLSRHVLELTPALQRARRGAHAHGGAGRLSEAGRL
tara:strand:+ start:389 stop:652 length:264 start_codon:yes stop_codon:yes gene_type:complete